MNYLVILDAQAGELGKILSGMKSMVVKDLDPAEADVRPVSPGDNLYFMKRDECALRVKATVVRVLPFTNSKVEELSHTLKELQPRLQLTEDQYNYWSTQKQALLVEFGTAQKMEVIYVSLEKNIDRSNWFAFEAFNLFRNLDGVL